MALNALIEADWHPESTNNILGISIENRFTLYAPMKVGLCLSGKQR